MGVSEGFQLTGVSLAFLCAILGLYWIYSRRKSYWYDKPIPSKEQIQIPFVGPILQKFLSGSQIHDTDKNLCLKYGKVFGYCIHCGVGVGVVQADEIRHRIEKTFAFVCSEKPQSEEDVFLSE